MMPIRPACYPGDADRTHALQQGLIRTGPLPPAALAFSVRALVTRLNLTQEQAEKLLGVR